MARPLIKWPGGKTSEIQQFAPLFPEYDRYIEPFVGGGAVLFYLQPSKAIINDISKNLMEFYALVKEQDPEFRRLLELYAVSLEQLKKLCEEQYADLQGLYRIYETADREKMDMKRLRLNHGLVTEFVKKAGLQNDLVLDTEEFLEQMLRMTDDKFRRTVENNKKQPFTEDDLKDNLITGFTSGFYMYFRNVFNQIGTGRIDVSRQYRAANFYYIREYCYGSMFRYNSKGEFNIPYGGVSYNKKNFKSKIDNMFCNETAQIMKGTEICCTDFEYFMQSQELTERDFMFLDPPYDTDFSDYEGKDFDKNDQKRLADLLKQTKARFLLVIKNTDYIYSLYKDEFRIMTFDNRYIYNMRSRNDRQAEHLIVTNIPETSMVQQMKEEV